jgi:hypothetical protein
MIFNSARLVRKGEELEHYHPEPAGQTNVGQPPELRSRAAIGFA